MRGYCGIGVFNGRYKVNFGGLIRSAAAFEADYVFSINARYEPEMPAAVGHDRHMPIHNYDGMVEFNVDLPASAVVVRVEQSDEATALPDFVHPERAVYVLGAEDTGFDRCPDRPDRVVSIPAVHCLNQATAGSVVLYDRFVKSADKTAEIFNILDNAHL